MIVPFSLKPGSSILISGCGGGFDFLCGTPLGFELEAAGHRVCYSSYTFSNLSWVREPRKLGPYITVVEADDVMKGADEYARYFPEKVFCEWYRSTFSRRTRVYCYQGLAVCHLRDAFDLVYDQEQVDYHFVVDGGCDGIFRGDEFDLGTPSTDAISIIAASRSKTRAGKWYVLTAFGTEGIGKGVSHAEALRRISERIADGSGLAVSSITNNREASRLFLSAFEYITASMPLRFQSTIASSIAASLAGRYGDQEVNAKTEMYKVWVSPLTSLVWYLDVKAVAESKLYYQEVLEAPSSIGVNVAIERLIHSRARGRREGIPI
ncbi:MAG TPA: DUF1152 domain-containing protein [Spirochaetia bacterium]|nr:DUF1152 domain-containing protein [Spirochaetia bacterium]